MATTLKRPEKKTLNFIRLLYTLIYQHVCKYLSLYIKYPTDILTFVKTRTTNRLAILNVCGFSRFILAKETNLQTSHPREALRTIL